MSKPIVLIAMAMIAMLAASNVCWGQDLPSGSFAFQSLLRNPGAGRGRPDVLCGLIYQDYEGAWVNYQKVSASFNEEGYHTRVTTSNWSPSLNDWFADTAVEFSYRDDNKLLHAELTNLVDGEWITCRTVNWSYNSDLLSEISSHWHQDGVEQLYTTTSFSYDPDSGYLDQVIETLWCFDPINPIITRYVYGWDSHGRKAWQQKYYKRVNDAEWTVDLRNTYSYLPEDESTYPEQLGYVQSGYGMTGNIFSYGPHPFMIDQDNIQYHVDADVWGDYYVDDYIYNEDNQLVGKQHILRFMGMDELTSEVRYTYENNRLASSTSYEAGTPGGFMEPVGRCLFVYSDNTADDDPAAPALTTSLSMYPNPFRESASIQVTLPKTGSADLSIFNLRGQKVREISASSLSGGQHQLVWDGKDSSGKIVNPGVYIIRLRSAGREIVCKALRL
ncbi:MAG TPA: FlgD immunoglobulin-like domain containing protein [Candidatus Cloacimonadota bacterium]|nr:FlgD immunoglobulin-like domain containing protein [Candidatus Cloacimonadota bacterium]